MGGGDPEGIRLKTNRTHLLLSLSPGHLHFLPLAPGLSSFIILQGIPMGTALELKDILKTKRAGCFSHLNGNILNGGKTKRKQPSLTRE